MAADSGDKQGQQRVGLTLVLVLGVILRLGILANTSTLGTPIVDEQHYTQLARNIAAGNGFVSGLGTPTSIRPPLYPALLAGVWTVTGVGVGSLQAMRAFQIVLALLTTWLVYLLGRSVFGEQVGRLGAAAFWLYPSLIFFNFTILTETLFTFLLVAFLLASVKLLDAPRLGTALVCGLTLGLAALTRSVMWPVPLLFCPLLFVLLRVPWRQRLLVPLAVLVGYTVVVAPWAVRNTRLQGVVTVVDTMGGLNMRMGNYEHTPDDRMWDAVALTGEKSWAHALRLERPGEILTEGQKEKWAQAKAIEYMVAHPRQTLRRSLIRFADFWGLEREYIAGIQQGLYAPPVWFAVLGSAAILIAYPLVMIAGAAGICLAPPEIRTHVLLLLPIVVIMGVHTLVFGHSRYHMPLVPILVLYGAALLTARRRIEPAQQRGPMLAACASVCILIVVWARQIFIIDADRLARLLNHG